LLALSDSPFILFASSSPLSPTNIFAPDSTPAHSLFRLSVFELEVEGAIFIIVFTLLAYAVIRFHQRRHDSTDGQVLKSYGGEGGIRTPGTRFSAYNGLANRRLKPLGHLSGVTMRSRHCILESTVATVPLPRAARVRYTSIHKGAGNYVTSYFNETIPTLFTP
jgi:hypothetical protein